MFVTGVSRTVRSTVLACGAFAVLSLCSCSETITTIVIDGNLDAVKKHIANGGDVNVRDRHRRTMVINAALGGQMEVLVYLLANGADVNATDKNGVTALHWAAYNHDVAMVKALTRAGANVNSCAATYEKGYSESHISANMDFPYSGGPLHWSLGGQSVLKKTERAGVTPDVLATVEALLDAGADPNIASEDGRKPLGLPLSFGNSHVARLLLQRGADPKTVTEALLHMAVAHDDCETAKLLIKAGCDVNQKASTAASWQPVDELVGNRVTFASGEAATPLQLAKSDRMRQLLREAGAQN